ncbi:MULTISPECIES: polysaccharide deacetylase family protein [Virgibacillus]|uniref:NodB homology domain-containing protein n=1 Tax=Virgibacillus kapii TaxID=1638645 RepID=A0ABQ2D3Q2_9BACI|nr:MULTISPECIES: polysaccharide deacetylase family protein [Virgibacillus]EQB36559.1 hypothetical protein M948_16125 [Virgibacillus sp. CM-4]GGJ42929.1 hypothetical protein GCM10007111_01270 [Virgibacillus kapii]
MKKVITILMLILVLAACGESAQPVSEKQSENENQTPEQTSGEEREQQPNQQDTESKPTEKKEEPKYKVSDDATIVPLKEGINEKVVLLTIDDVPDKYAVEMAKTLKKLNVQAIFFANGHFLETPEQKKQLKEIHEMGFIIGNHTYSHANLTTLSEKEQTEEIVKVSDQIEEIIGERPKFFRAPHGMNTDHSKQVAKEENMVLMNWTYGYDYFEPYMNVEKLTNAMITGEGPEVDIDYSLLKPGANLLMHDREWTNKALADIVNGLRDKGYEMVDPHQIKTID